jgi:hypothetical protein
MKATIEIEFGDISCVSDSGNYCPLLDVGEDECVCNLFSVFIASVPTFTRKFDRRRIKRCKECRERWPFVER